MRVRGRRTSRHAGARLSTSLAGQEHFQNHGESKSIQAKAHEEFTPRRSELPHPIGFDGRYQVFSPFKLTHIFNGLATLSQCIGNVLGMLGQSVGSAIAICHQCMHDGQCVGKLLVMHGLCVGKALAM